MASRFRNRSRGAQGGVNLLVAGAWSLGDGWSDNSGELTHAAGGTSNVSQTGVAIGGAQYRVRYDITSSDFGGFVAFRLGDINTNISATTPNTVGSYEFFVTANSVDDTFALRCGAGLTAVFDNISLLRTY